MNDFDRERLRQIVEDPVWKAAIDEVKQDLYVTWCDHAADAMERDQMFHTKKALDALVSKLVNLAHAG